MSHRDSPRRKVGERKNSGQTGQNWLVKHNSSVREAGTIWVSWRWGWLVKALESENNCFKFTRVSGSVVKSDVFSEGRDEKKHLKASWELSYCFDGLRSNLFHCLRKAWERSLKYIIGAWICLEEEKEKGGDSRKKIKRFRTKQRNREEGNFSKYKEETRMISKNWGIGCGLRKGH